MAAEKRLFGQLIQLGTNCWGDLPCPRPAGERAGADLWTPPQKMLDRWGPIYWEMQRLNGEADYLRFDEACWRDVTEKMAAQGMNFVLIDLAEGIVYTRHPELAVKGSWTPEKLRGELARLRQLGLEPLPKLNFSTTHDLWLKEYARMVSTPTYYQVVADLIDDVCELFDTPRFFHVGYDEEDAQHQRNYRYAVVRQGELWWHDLAFVVREVERNGARAWMWADKIWHDRAGFERRMSRDVLVSNWYYLLDFDPPKTSELYPMVHAYEWLEKAGFDQVPTSSSCTDYSTDPRSAQATADHTKKIIAPSRLKGFLQSSWQRTEDRESKLILESIRQLGAVKRGWKA